MRFFVVWDLVFLRRESASMLIEVFVKIEMATLMWTLVSSIVE